MFLSVYCPCSYKYAEPKEGGRIKQYGFHVRLIRVLQMAIVSGTLLSPSGSTRLVSTLSQLHVARSTNVADTP